MIHLAILGATAVLFVLALSGLPRPAMAGLLTPAGLLLAFLALATGLVPLLWLVGVAEPWDEIRDRPLAAAGTTLLCFLFFALGKGGSDGFLRTLLLHLLAVVAMTVVAKTSATVASWNELTPLTVDVTRDARLRRRHTRPPRATLRPG